MRNDDVEFNFYAFWGFNIVILLVYFTVRIIGVFASIGLNYVLATGSTEVQASTLGILGSGFATMLVYGSLIVLQMFIVSVWFFGNIWIARHLLAELYSRFAKEYLHEGDL